MKTEQLLGAVDFQDFLKRYCSDELEDLWMQYPREKRDLWVDYQDLLRFNIDLADVVLEGNGTVTPDDNGTKRKHLTEALARAVAELDNPVDCQPDPQDLTVRYYNFGSETLSVGEYWADTDLGEYRSVSGQVANATEQRPGFETISWECQRCGYNTPTYPSDPGELQEPAQCGSCERQGPFQINESESVGVDYQVLRLEKPAEERQTSTSPTLDVFVRGDLVKHIDARDVNSGSRITASGELAKKPDANGWLMKARAITVDDDDIAGVEPEPEEKERIQELASGAEGDVFELLVESIAPSLKGAQMVEEVEYLGEERTKMWWIKLLAALSGLFQGWRRPNGDGTYQRGTSHLFLIGDPSTGKSTILDAIESISPRSATTSGQDATAAGLTAAAVNDDFDGNNWTLEAGVLVKGHRGVATIDELDKMKESAVSSMHQALEKQRVEVSKAGIEATLPCETSLLAAGNPRDSRFNSYEDKHDQIDIVGSLLDRFDIIFTMEDEPDEEIDREIAKHILETRTEAGRVARGEKESEAAETSPAVGEDLLRKWVAYARENYRPIVEDEQVKERIVDFYTEIRSANTADEEGDGPVPATTRSIEGVLRLAEAAARAELSNEIEMRHADIAIEGIRASLQDVGYDEETGQIDIDRLLGETEYKNRDARGKLYGIIKERETRGDGAPIDEVLETASSAGVQNPERHLDKLRRSGRVYEPAEGRVRTNG